MADFDISDEVHDFFSNLSKDDPTDEVTSETPVSETPTGDEEVIDVETPVEQGEVEQTLETAENAPEALETPTEETPPAEDAGEEELHPAEVARRQQQAVYDQKIAELSQNLSQMSQWAQQQYAWQQQMIAEQHQQVQQAQQASQVNVTREQLDQAIETDLQGSFQWVVANRPDLVGPTIAMVRQKEQYGHEVADLMQVEFNQYLHNQSIQQMESARAESEAPAQIEQAMAQVASTLEQRHGETFKALESEVGAKAQEMAPHFLQYMRQQGEEITPQAVYDFITNVYFDVRESKLATASSQPRTAVPMTPQQHIESSNAAPRQEISAEEDAINEIVRGARSMGIDVNAASV